MTHEFDMRTLTDRQTTLRSI